jgi:hypothetical protein
VLTAFLCTLSSAPDEHVQLDNSNFEWFSVMILFS